MAKQINGILGEVHGKVGNVVGGKWKETPYYRAYVKPANPRTPAQQAHRAKMTFLVKLGKKINVDVLQPYLSYLSKSMSAFNSFMKINIPLMSDPLDYLDVKIADGSLEGPSFPLEGCVEAGSLGIPHDAHAAGNGLDTDVQVFILWDWKNLIASVVEGVRYDLANTQIPVVTDFDVTQATLYSFLYRGEGDARIYSPTSAATVEMC